MNDRSYSNTEKRGRFKMLGRQKCYQEEVHIHLKDKPDVMYADVGEELAKLNTLFEFYLSQAYGYKEKQDGGR